jgi:dTDP-4-dehydrorhamnose reductase
MDNIVILGDGLLGTELHKQTGWDILSRKKDKIEATNIVSWSGLLLPYDTIINCIANTNTYSNNRKSHWDVNYKFVSDLVTYCNEHGKKLIHISTDYVYTNSIGIPTEEDIPVHQATHYAHTKLLADGYIELKSKNYLILRATHKPTPFPYEGAWINQLGNFDYVDVIASMMVKLIKGKANGVFNVGTEFKSMYTLAKQTNPKVNPIYNTDIRIPLNNTMNTDKYESYE